MDRKMFLRTRLGRMDQLCSMRQTVLDEGRGRGVRLIEIDNGSGLAFTVMPDRCCDIYDARYKGVPLAWLAPNGIVSPNAYEPEGLMWLRSWPGGLLTTAGLLNAGGPETSSDGQAHGLHGRAAHLAAEDLALQKDWTTAGDYELSVSGVIRHTMVFGEKLELRRTISTQLGSNVIAVRDRIENQGFAPVPLMMLYHCNFGYPLVDETAHLEARSRKVMPKDEHSAAGVADWARLEAPQHGYGEELFFHDIEPDADGMARISIVNPTLKLRLAMAYDPRTLPVLNQWKQMGEGEYVTGLEPGNCIPTGRTDNEKKGILRMVAPGETVEFAIRIEVTEL